VSVSLGIEHSMHMGHTVFCIFPRYLINSATIERSYRTQNIYSDFLYRIYLKYFSFYEELSEIWSNTSSGLRVKYPLFLSDFNESIIFIFFKRSNIKFYENPASGNRVFPWGQTNRHEAALVAFRSFANAPNKTRVTAVYRGRSILANVSSQTVAGTKWTCGAISQFDSVCNFRLWCALPCYTVEARM